jgi:hypothetical protein
MRGTDGMKQRQLMKQLALGQMYGMSGGWPLNASRLERTYLSRMMVADRFRRKTMDEATRLALRDMSPEEVATTIQVAGTDQLFMDALTREEADAVTKASIENASKHQEATGDWPTFEDWIVYRSKMIHDALRGIRHE